MGSYTETATPPLSIMTAIDPIITSRATRNTKGIITNIANRITASLTIKNTIPLPMLSRDTQVTNPETTSDIQNTEYKYRANMVIQIIAVVPVANLSSSWFSEL